MEIENFTYPEALRHLAKKYGIEIEEDVQEISEAEKESRNQRELLYKIHEVANNFFQDSCMILKKDKILVCPISEKEG
jgi:DNA primase